MASLEGASTRPSAPLKFNPQQRELLDAWHASHVEWNVQCQDNANTGTEMIVVELPPYLDLEGVGLNLRNWVIYPAADDHVRVLFWDDQESCYTALCDALNDIACLRASRR